MSRTNPAVTVRVEPYCCDCPYMDLQIDSAYVDNRVASFDIYCRHKDQCEFAVHSDVRDRPIWHPVEDELPAEGEVVLCAMEKDGIWYPRWGYREGEAWRVIIQSGSRVMFPVGQLSHWMYLSPPTPMPEPVVADKGKTGLEKIREMGVDELIETLTGRWVDICPPPFQRNANCVKDISCSECWRTWLTEPEVRDD